MTELMTVRPATPADAPLLFALFAEEKAAELAPLGLSAEQLQPLLEMQYRGREFSYSQSATQLADSILCLEDGTPAGRMLVDRQVDCYRVMDIAVLAAHRKGGIGKRALQELQQEAKASSLPIRLRVMKDSPALRLYERLAFKPIDGDELSIQMEWNPASVAHAACTNQLCTVPIRSPDHQENVSAIVAFLREIGLTVEFGATADGDFLPGIQMIRNGLRLDKDALLYPGDLLHEAGHLAVMPQAHREAELPSSSDAAEEMAAMAWSYAAASHLGISPSVVFHENGYRGQAHQLLDDFSNGKAIGLPYLWWIGMTTQPQLGRPSIYPRMLHWLRPAFNPAQEEELSECTLQAQV